MRKCQLIACFTALALFANAAKSQNYSSSGQNWSAGWGFSSVSDRSLAMQQAQAIRAAKTQPGPSTVITYNNNTTNSYDNRSSYQEVIGEFLTIDTIDFQLNGDRIGQNTNSVGSMNTGTTNIDIIGDQNSIIATNSADNEGCVDGSAQQETNIFDSLVTPFGIDIGLQSSGRAMKCAQ